MLLLRRSNVAQAVLEVCEDGAVLDGSVQGSTKVKYGVKMSPLL